MDLFSDNLIDVGFTDGSSYQLNIISSSISSSVNEYQTKIDALIQNFDGFEYYLYLNHINNDHKR